MKILVPVKRVVDYNAKIRVKSDGSGVETDHLKFSMNPFDEIAVEEAIRLKEKGIATEVIVISIGTTAAQETLRTALATGADRAILVESDQDHEPLHIAKILAKLIEQETPEIVLMGKQAIDNDCNQVGQMLAGLLGWAQATFASSINLENGKAQVAREVDGGLETIEVTLPCVITTDLRLNEPRYANMANIMKAKSKPMDTIALDSLSLSLNPHIKTLKVEPPKMREAGVMLEDFAQMIEKIKESI